MNIQFTQLHILKRLCLTHSSAVYLCYQSGIHIWLFLKSPLFHWSCCSVSKSCPALCDLTDCSTPGFPVLHCFLEFVQTHVHWVSDAIQSSLPLSPCWCSSQFLHQLYIDNYWTLEILIVSRVSLLKFIHTVLITF